MLGSLLRSRWFPVFLRGGLPRLIPTGHDLEPYLPWFESEIHRGNSRTITEAGWALSSFDARTWARKSPKLSAPDGVALRLARAGIPLARVRKGDDVRGALAASREHGPEHAHAAEPEGAPA